MAGADGGTAVPGTLEAASTGPLAPATPGLDLDRPRAAAWSWARDFTSLHQPPENGELSYCSKGCNKK